MVPDIQYLCGRQPYCRTPVKMICFKQGGILGKYCRAGNNFRFGGMENRTNHQKKGKRAVGWKKELEKEVRRFIKEKAKTKRVGEKVHRKAVKARKKKVEKSLDRLLVGSCFLVCLTAALKDARNSKK